jgi:hypothetical protein
MITQYSIIYSLALTEWVRNLISCISLFRDKIPYHKASGSIPADFVWRLWWTYCLWIRHSSKLLRVSLINHHTTIAFYSSTTDRCDVLPDLTTHHIIRDYSEDVIFFFIDEHNVLWIMSVIPLTIAWLLDSFWQQKSFFPFEVRIFLGI